jgi:hypothetical protein
MVMVIASRELTLRDGDKLIKISIRIFTPEFEKQGVWKCQYEVDWPGENHSVDAYGFDGIQALFIALQMVGAEIYTSSYHKDGRLYWDKPGSGYGFPIASSLRDLLQGDDKKYL